MLKTAFEKFLFLSVLLTCHIVCSQELHWQNVPVAINSSFRAVSVVDNDVVWISGNNGWVGRSTNGGKNWIFKQISNFDSLDFRSLYAFDSLTAIIANAGSPAFVLKTSDGGKNWKVVYENNSPSIFIDGIDFWDRNEGIIYGDPIEGRMFLIRTKDSGSSWKEISWESRPVLEQGEASFAASGTGIRCIGKNKLIIATGGAVSRLWISKDKGIRWNSLVTPILQGYPTTGIFSVAFFDQTKGIIVGGDYQRDTLKTNHVFYTLNSGAQWLYPSKPTRGYMESVEFINDSVVMATGPQGTDISFDSGINWKSFSNEKQFHVIRKARKGSLIIAAGNRKIALIKSVD